MSNILRAKVVRDDIYIPEIQGIEKIEYRAMVPTLLVRKDGKKVQASCLNCANPRCMKLSKSEIECCSFPGMSHDVTMDICPVNAIRQSSDGVKIDGRKCFGCGLCVSRCPVGAIFLNNEKANINLNNNLPRKKTNLTVMAIKKQEERINKLLEIEHFGNMVMENETNMDKIYKKIKKLSPEKQNIFARNILICLSNRVTMSRRGDVAFRMDGYYENSQSHGVIEVETGLDMLDVSRAILDDIAVLNSRHNIPKEENVAVAICLHLANRRTDYWQEIKDIREVTGLRINTVTFAILLVFLWNGLKVNDFSGFYIDVDDSSLRNETERLLGRKVRISVGHEGMIENRK